MPNRRLCFSHLHGFPNSGRSHAGKHSKQDSRYDQPHDWVLLSPHILGKTPYWRDILPSRILRPAAVGAGIEKHIGWNTFRHTFSTILAANGENLEVVQEVMRNANCRTALEIYFQARIQAKRAAQSRIVEMIIPGEPEAIEVDRRLIATELEAATNGF